MSNLDIQEALDLKYPIFWNDMAIERDFAIRLIYKIITSRPKIVVEIGAGISTLITLKTLNNLGIDHKVYSIDADEWFLNETKNLLIAEGLYNSEHIELIHAPIKQVKLDGKQYLWHDLKEKKWSFEKIDLLTVDGPIGSLSKESRYPAVPYFKNYLRSGSCILLDDFNREDERSIVGKWLRYNKGLEFIYRGPSGRGQAEMILHDSRHKKVNKTLPPPIIGGPDPKDEELSRLHTELYLAYNSRSWKLSRKLAAPVNKIRRYTKS